MKPEVEVICYGCKQHTNDKLKYYLTLAATENPNHIGEDKIGSPLDDRCFCDVVCLRDWLNQFIPSSVV